VNRDTTCSFTGHRPEKLPWGLQEEAAGYFDLCRRLLIAIHQVYDEGVRHFITGMARGSDLYFAQAVLRLREEKPNVTLEAARPCESQADGWTQKEKLLYHSILDRCDYETLVQHSYDRGCMMRRNRYMVNHSAWLIAVYNGIPQGGTAQTLAYALNQGLRVNILSLGEEPE